MKNKSTPLLSPANTPPDNNNKRLVLYAWFGWAILFIVMAALIAAGSDRTVVPSYRGAALDWLGGRDLYDGTGGGFLYLPQSSIFFTFLALLPVVLGEILWRFANICIFAIGIFSFVRLAGKKAEAELFPLVTLVTIPMAWSCARNGQATLAMTGLILLAGVAVADRRWWWATLYLVIAVAIKPLAIVPALLIMATERSMIWRLVLGMLAFALFPFLTQHPDYVIEQYLACLSNTTNALHVGVVVPGWTTPFTALRVGGLNVPEGVQTVIRLVAAVGTLVLCLFTRRRHNAAVSVIFLLSLAILYLLLFSPRTENNTYAMLGPIIGLFLALAFQVEKRYGESFLLAVIAMGVIATHPIERLLAPHAEKIWLSPLLGICFTVYLLIKLFTYPDNSKEMHELFF